MQYLYEAKKSGRNYVVKVADQSTSIQAKGSRGGESVMIDPPLVAKAGPGGLTVGSDSLRYCEATGKRADIKRERAGGLRL